MPLVSTPKRRLAVYAKSGNRCAQCALVFPVPDGYDGKYVLSAPGYVDRRGCPRLRLLEVDHIVPRSLGGTNELSNLQALCTQCNVRKGARV